MSIELTGVLTLHKAEVIPGEGQATAAKWEMPDFFIDEPGVDIVEKESSPKPLPDNPAPQTDVVAVKDGELTRS